MLWAEGPIVQYCSMFCILLTISAFPIRSISAEPVCAHSFSNAVFLDFIRLLFGFFCPLHKLFFWHTRHSKSSWNILLHLGFFYIQGMWALQGEPAFNCPSLDQVVVSCLPWGVHMPTMLSRREFQDFDPVAVKDRWYISKPGWCVIIFIAPLGSNSAVKSAVTEENLCSQRSQSTLRGSSLLSLAR